MIQLFVDNLSIGIISSILNTRQSQTIELIAQLSVVNFLYIYQTIDKKYRGIKYGDLYTHAYGFTISDSVNGAGIVISSLFSIY